MALESATYISDLVVTNPLGSDPLAFADDHIRLIKSSIKTTFPSITGAITKTHEQINDGLEKAGGTMTGSLILSGAPTVDLQASTKAYVDAAVLAAITTASQNVYPVGSIYTNATVDTNPATLLGFGTWAAFGAGRVPVGFNATDPLFDTVEETGGSKDAVVVSHTHGITDPGHAHSYNRDNLDIVDGGPFTRRSGTGTQAFTTTTAATGISVNSAGVSGTNANLQPYITVYMWKRTA